MKKVGIMGGTFDPIHIGHLIIAEHARQQLGLDKVIFMPAGNPPHKTLGEDRAGNEQRTAMVQLAISSNPYFELSLLEMHENGYSYTYKTLKLLTDRHPDTRYYFIIGADSLFSFHTWYRPEEICRHAAIVVANRNHTNSQALDQEIRDKALMFNGEFIRLDTENIDISSSQVRSWIKEGQTVKYYLPDDVLDYIRREKLYII